MKTLSLFLSFCFLSIYLSAQVKNGTEIKESEILLHTKTGEISGTLTLPANLQQTPVVLIIAGSGPTDRDCNSPLGVQCNAYKMLAEGFAKNGISSLRFDKRGIGKSKFAMKSEENLRFDTYVNDVKDWVYLLKSDKRFSKVILLGHSEGSLIGILAAQNSNVSALISAAGVGKPADQVLRDQIKGKLAPQAIIESNRILDSMKRGVQLYPSNADLNAIFRPSVQPYMISWIKYNPAKEIGKVKVPVLIVQGTTDLQVSPEHAKLLQAGKPGAKLKIFDNMNHILKESSPNPIENQSTYRNPNLPLKSGLVDELTSFIKSLK